jgi:hypothetical protein
MGGRSTGSTPTRTLPRQGGGEVFEGDGHDIPLPVSPSRGSIRVGEKLCQSSPPTRLSSIEAEGTRSLGEGITRCSASIRKNMGKA